MKELSQFDINNNGVVTGEEMNKAEKIMAIENEDKKQDAQRRMAWFALFGMLLYPFAVVAAAMTGHENAAKILGDMAATYFVAVAAIVAAFYGKEAYVSSRQEKVISITPRRKDPVLDPVEETPMEEISVVKKPIVRRPNL